ncbi:lasso peptide biosynthesis PqqD family chaperone [Pseudomonas sp. PDM16]|uniref:lasso peptide biosynthesis PqqD family chaperone n=1 Tax=Pseudomonas sp. PDM16 TaxID=2769292 RepID=UPI001783243A|nr:lasso peptide biosynthesis PqqD family chaperone [Pseudomonas sp. PDM16]MBD9415033.1 lasso peptide biosynthesis PqqD family chaperone [Pseudomonas sp. PDM16]
MVEVTPHSLIARNPDLVAADMNGDIVMMSIERGAYFGISGVGTRIWELLEQPASVEALVRAIHAEYEVDEPTCQRDMLVFVRELVKHGVVSLAG